MSLLRKHSARKLGIFKKSKSKSIETDYTSQDLPALRRKRTIAYKRLTKALEVGTLAASDLSQRDLFLSYYQDVKQIAANFEDAHFTILEILDDPENEDNETQERFDDMYYQILSIHRNLTKLESTHSHSTSSNIRLPKIVLPTFSGNIKQWPEYFDTFNALIHNSNSLSDTEKFHYLISSLSGDALAIVKTFPMTHEHYRDAYEALTARYKSKRDLAFTCWRDILNINFKYNDGHSFRKSLDLFEENLCILKTINLPIGHWDFILVYHILSKLEPDLRRCFEEKYSDVELPSYEQLKGFLQSKCEALLRDTHFSGSTKTNKSFLNFTSTPSQSKRINTSHVLVAANTKPTTSSTTTNVSYTSKCPFCSETHSILSCSEFINKSHDERMKIANDKKWCFNCLKSSHQLKNCKSIFSCRTCKRKHHTLLHRDNSIDSNQSVSLVSRSPTHTTVLLATAIVQVKDASGRMHSFRALFDTGSQSNFITEAAVRRLNLKSTRTTSNVSGLGDVTASLVGHVTCSVGTNNKTLFSLDMNVITRICGDQPIAKLNTSGWSHIQSLPLADPGFDIPGSIDLLFAADVFAESLLSQRIKGDSNQPIAFNSVFGWLLLGKTRLDSSTLVHTSLDIDNELNSLVQRFWELDSTPKQSSPWTLDELICEQKFVSDHSRDPSGRYIVRLPFKNDSEPTFEGSREVALRRFHAIERRLSRDPNLYTQYTEFMSDYIETGHMSVVPVDELATGKYYIPHHCVLRPDSSTTRLRVVFDASAKDHHSRSLNESLLIGPKLQPNILEILLRFREHVIVIMSDARQMYRQILISPDHRDYQRIFWRDSTSDPVQEYRLNTVTYGVSSSPFLACRTLRQLAEDNGDSYPLAKKIILSDIYIDDIVTGCDTFETAKQTKIQLIALFKLGGFELRKWVSNDPSLLSDLPVSNRLSGSVSLDNSETSTLKVLGLRWDSISDSFLFEILPSDRPCTKRAILSELARIFDPLGFLSPITIKNKSYIQKLWILGIGWDQTPPDEIISIWNTYKNQLPELARLRIPRKLTRTEAQSYELHGFCDSSETAFGAVIYLRVTDKDDTIHVFLVCSKARVAPLKRISLPRLELCAAVLLSDLYNFVRNTYLDRIPIDAVYLWSDSTVVLSWLRSHSSRWVTFVANRVSHIQNITPIEWWHHVASGDNPADICSRGQLPRELLYNSLWWAGPTWLSENHKSWPSNSHNISHTAEEKVIVKSEKRRPVTLISSKIHESVNIEDNIVEKLLTRFSSLQKIINVLTYINRFINNSRNVNYANRHNFLNNVERHKALMQLVKHVQSQAFSNEISNLRNNTPLSKPFRKLNPFLDAQGVLRVGGRISRSGLEYEHKHPAFLPSNHALTFLVIDHIHKTYLHPGINTTHFVLLQQFWIVAAKRTIRHRLSKCVKCFRTNPQPLQPFMSDLPSFRVNQVKPFSVVGVDFGGPFRIKLGLHRGAKIDKAYLCLFVCLSTKAVHLEVVSTLSSDGFIAALRRFVGRRGRCNVIHADCGTNFIGARNQLSSLMQQASSAEKIEFKFNPPAAPHFGGIWEIQIKAAKSHLYRVIGDQVLTFEELTTLFVQIEAILNSRPLYPISSDPNDLSCLTPGHFLTLEPLTAVPDEDLSTSNIKRLHRWQMLQAFHQNFWSRWKTEYLNSLIQRAKWTKHSKPLSIGSMVILKDDNRSPLQWALARVVKLQSGEDGIARSAVVRTPNNNLIQRPLVKLCPLPIEN